MIGALIVVASLCSFALSLECPPGSSQIGAANSFISGNVLMEQNNGQSGAECAQKCAVLDGCKAFAYDEDGSRTLCTFYTTDAVTGIGELTSSVLCKPMECPADSKQIGAWNTDISQGGWDVTATCIDACDAACAADTSCMAYSWAPESSKCRLFPTIVPDQNSAEPQILCKRKCTLESGTLSPKTPYCWGDPHCGTWTGWPHHFQGPVVYEGDSYYLVKNCDTTDYSSMPFSLSMAVFPWGNVRTVLEYLTLEIYAGPNLETDTYYFFIGTITEQKFYAQLPVGTSRMLAEVLAGEYANRVKPLVYDNQWKSFGANGDYKVKFSQAGWLVSIMMQLPEGSKVCEPSFTLRYQGQRHDASAQNPRKTLRHHRVEGKMSQCYYCETCGLFGDFQSPWRYLKTCDGSTINAAPCETDNTALPCHRLMKSGWGWGTEYVDENCKAKEGKIEVQPVQPACSEEVQKAAIIACQKARDAAKQCCDAIGGNYCDDVQFDCEIDVCATAVNDVSAVPALVQEEFTNAVTEHCEWHYAPTACYMWEFNGDLTESITKNPAYSVSITGNAQIDENGLICDSTNGNAQGTVSINQAIGTYSIEVLVKVSDLERGGCIISTNMGNEFQSIAYDQMIPSCTTEKVDQDKFSVISGFTTDTADRARLKGIFGALSTAWHAAVESSSDELVYLVTTFDVANKKVIIYRNGELYYEYTTNDFLECGATGFEVDFCSGPTRSFLKQNFAGTICFAAIYCEALSSTDVKSFYKRKVLCEEDGTSTNIEIISDELLCGDRLYRGQALVSVNAQKYRAILTNAGTFMITDDEGEVYYEYGPSTAAYLEYTAEGALILFDDSDNEVKVVMEANNDCGRVIMETVGELTAFDSSDNEYDSIPCQETNVPTAAPTPQPTELEWSCSTANTVQMTTLQPQSFHVPYWGSTYVKNQVPWGARQTSMLMADGNTYTSFLVIHAVAQITYALNGEYSQFKAVLGLALTTNGCEKHYDTSGHGDSQMEIFVDGVSVFLETYKTTKDFDIPVIDVTGAQTLQIKSYNLGSGGCDHDTVANPLLCYDSTTTTTSTSTTSTSTTAEPTTATPTTATPTTSEPTPSPTVDFSCSVNERVDMTTLTPDTINVPYWPNKNTYTPNKVPWTGDTTMSMADGATYSSFLVLHAPATLSYPLNGAYGEFKAVLGLALTTNNCVGLYDSTTNGLSSIEILVDGKSVIKVDLNKKDDYKTVVIDVSGAQEITFKTDSVGATNCDHDTVANPLLCPAVKKLGCPAGTDQLGPLNADISGSTLKTVADVMSDECENECLQTAGCKAFVFQSDNGELGTCILKSSDSITGAAGTHQVCCRPLGCPPDSSQIGAINADISDTNNILPACSATTLDACDAACVASTLCVSYSWQPGTSTCTLYSTIVPDSTSAETQILCKQKCVLKHTPGAYQPYGWGDPHFRTVTGIVHHFQGPIEAAGNAYYLIKSCDTNDRVSMPFAVIGVVYPWNVKYTVMQYGVLALYTGPNPDTDTYYLFLSNQDNSEKVYGQFPLGTSPILTEIRAGQYANRLQPLTYGSGNWMTFGGNNNIQVEIYISGYLTWVNIKETKGPTICETQFYVRYQGKGWETRHHRLQQTKISSCYYCEQCGLFGDFLTTGNGIQKCDGSVFAHPDSQRYSENGYTWETKWVDSDCKGDDKAFVEPSEDCTQTVKNAVIIQCQTARDAQKQCCDDIGGDYCEQIQLGCEIDVCATADDDVTVVPQLVQQVFTNEVVEECAFQSVPNPSFLWAFDGDVSESVTGEAKYDLTLQGNAKITANGLECDGVDSGAKGEVAVDVPIGAHTMEALVTLEDIESGGAIMSTIVDATATTDEMYSTIAYQQLYGRKNPTTSDRRRIAVASGKYIDPQSNSNKLTTIYNKAHWGQPEEPGPDLIHVAATFDVSNNMVKLYRNGQEVFSYTTGEFLVADGTTGFRVDFCSSIERQFLRDDFHGKIHYGALYSQVLTADEVLLRYKEKVLEYTDGTFNNFEILDDELLPGEKMYKGQVLASVAERKYRLILKYNGSLVLTDDADTELYNSGETNAEYLKYTTNGVLALFDSSDTNILEIIAGNGNPGRVLMQTNGKLVAYSGAGTAYASIPATTSGKANMFNFDGGNFGFGANYPYETHSKWVLYGMYVMIVLLIANIVVKIVQCIRNQMNTHAYKAVSVEGTEVDTDSEAEPLA